MITTGFAFIAVICGLCGILVWVEQQYPSALFRWFPSVVLVMFGSMAMYTLGFWEMTTEVRSTRAQVRDNLIPAMLFLMAIKFDLRVIRKLGARLVTLLLGSTASVMIAFIIVQQIMGPMLGDETPLTFGVMSAGWTGGTQNFVAVKEALQVSDSAMTYTLLMGALCYSVWLVILIALKPFKSRFNDFLKADNIGLDKVLDELKDTGSTENPDFQALMLMLGLALVVAALSHTLGSLAASQGFLNAMVWAIIVASLAGMVLAPTKFGKLCGSHELSSIMLYIIVALIGAEVNLMAVTQAPGYILAGFMILTIHGATVLLIGRLLRVNLHICCIASIANIGSASSATIVAAAYDKNLVPIAIIMSLVGSMLGSFVGLMVSEILVGLS
ncbi:MAG: DUF819 domain-containing protein [Gammaproteobacteria bacterium]|jgi:uncharacterized membrane protein|nr:DUF819 domain-containing protein [Gammaproteobacteria bacterium]MBT5204543.1 DUF819 domain-containing protein [Gammaproteobacteria bacterium]MBT5602326.1 DUF819 domain-containing protein [Gammaproteobacteria bacterium]MBT6247239.1 DUF819 domain-containing protein [Gammaproteobacteria bacterium]